MGQPLLLQLVHHSLPAHPAAAHLYRFRLFLPQRFRQRRRQQAASQRQAPQHQQRHKAAQAVLQECKERGERGACTGVGSGPAYWPLDGLWPTG